MRALVILTAALALAGWPATAGAQAVTYDVSTQSRLDVVTGKAGLLGGFGHGHRIRAGSASGTIVHDPAAPGSSTVEITVRTGDLHVVPIGADRKDGPSVERAMREDVLHVERWPTIAFRSRSVTATAGGVRVTGDLTLAGQTHPVIVDMRLQTTAGRLIADGHVSIRQTDWGIEPYKAALGTIQVADEVTLELHVVGLPRPGS